jgi:hypothetical protein
MVYRWSKNRDIRYPHDSLIRVEKSHAHIAKKTAQYASKSVTAWVKTMLAIAIDSMYVMSRSRLYLEKAASLRKFSSVRLNSLFWESQAIA